MKAKLTNAEVKKILKHDNNVVFEYPKKYGGVLKLKTHKHNPTDGETCSIYDAEPFGQGMNIEKWGSKFVTLYTFDLFSQRTSFKLEYSKVKFG